MSELGQKLIAAVRQKAAGDPYFIYKSPEDDKCLYVHNGQPSCIIGHAMWDAGVIDAQYEHDQYNDSSFRWLYDERYVDDLGELAIGEVEWLTTVQAYQDSRATWAGAVAAADTQA